MKILKNQLLIVKKKFPIAKILFKEIFILKKN